MFSLDRFPPPLGCIHDSLISHTGIKECGVALAVHRNSTNNGLIVTSGTEHASSSTDTFGFGYGRTMALMIRYDTRIRIHASYGCTIKIGYEEATLTGGKFIHGGVSLKAEADCTPGSWVDLIPEDWRLLTSGKKRLVFDHTCGIIPLCSDPPTPNSPPPQLPAPNIPPCPPPRPPPFPPGTINLPPFAPKVASPGSPPGEAVTVTSESIVLVATALLAVASFGLISYFICCFRQTVRKTVGTTFKRASNGAGLGESVPLARIAPDGTSSVVHGVLVSESGSDRAARVHRKDKRVQGEREALLSDVSF